ncbi:hypothetical protein JYU34_005270 [Plutella xylostella]|uniref:Uncharacterized protein n=1 Tax=Plutella xylostella TaxID=51655 RepID=A0ABQ7QW98_PLUXY|nr:hypothetical protein JYU34_005270 [Plutella xylostella]
MAFPGIVFLSDYVESLWSSPRPLLDWSSVPTLVLAVTLLFLIVMTLLSRTSDKHRLPGPPALPFLGTRWLFWSRYKMNKLHEAYEGATGRCSRRRRQAALPSCPSPSGPHSRPS